MLTFPEAITHEQGTDLTLDFGGPNEVSAADLRIHLDNDSKHRLINDSGSSAIELFSSQKINAELALVELSANKGAANGYAPLDGSSQVPLINLPASVQTGSEYKGVYNATTNTPTIINGTGANGDYHRVSVAGTQDFGAGPISFDIGDLVLYNGTLLVWELVNGNPDLVVSVAGKQGIVTLQNADITDFQAGVSANTDVAANSAHRIVVSGNPHSVTAAEVGAIGGSIENQQIAFGSGTDIVDGTGNLSWTGSLLFVNGQINGAFLNADSDKASYSDTKTTALGSTVFGIGSKAENNGVTIGRNSGKSGVRGIAIGVETQPLMNSADNITIGYQVLRLAPSGTCSNIIGNDSCRDLAYTGSDNNLLGSSLEMPSVSTSDYVSIVGTIIGDSLNKRVRIAGGVGPAIGPETFTVVGDSLLNGNVEVTNAINLQGGQQQLVTQTADAAYNVLKTTSLINFDTTANDIVATLPAIVAGSADDGRHFIFFRQTSGLNKVNLTPQAPSTIRGEATDIVLGLRSDSIKLLAVGGNWFPLNRDTFAIAVLDQLTPGETQLIPIVTPAVVTAFDTDLFETDGILDSDFTSNNITVIHNESLTAGGDGFKIGFRIECAYANNAELFAQIFVNGNPVNIEDVRTSSNAFNTVLEAEGVVRVATAPEAIDVRIIGTSNTNVTYEQCTLIVERVGK